MPSMVIGFLSGGTNILSGNYFSGRGSHQPVGGMQVRADRSNSGNLYITLSGGVTILSGGFIQSGFAGAMDGLQIGPGDGYFVPKLGLSLSGNPQVFVIPDSACSGQARLFFESF